MKPWKWICNTKLLPYNTILSFLMASAVSIYISISTGMPLLNSCQTATLKQWLSSRVQCLDSPLLTPNKPNPGQNQGPSMLDPTVASSRCNRVGDIYCFSYMPLWELSHDKNYKWIWNHLLGYKKPALNIQRSGQVSITAITINLQH